MLQHPGTCFPPSTQAPRRFHDHPATPAHQFVLRTASIAQYNNTASSLAAAHPAIFARGARTANPRAEPTLLTHTFPHSSEAHPTSGLPSASGEGDRAQLPARHKDRHPAAPSVETATPRSHLHRPFPLPRNQQTQFPMKGRRPSRKRPRAPLRRARLTLTPTQCLSPQHHPRPHRTPQKCTRTARGASRHGSLTDSWMSRRNPQPSIPCTRTGPARSPPSPPRGRCLSAPRSRHSPTTSSMDAAGKHGRGSGDHSPGMLPSSV